MRLYYCLASHRVVKGRDSSYSGLPIFRPIRATLLS